MKETATTETNDRKRAEEIAELTQSRVWTLNELVDAIVAYAAEVRAEQREKDAKIAENTWVTVAVGKVSVDRQAEYERAKIAAAIRNEAKGS